MAQAPHLHLSPDAIYPFDARAIAKRFRHAAIFGALDALHPGETMRFVNDHDPLPLLDQLAARYGERVSIEYRQREPGAIVIDFVKRGIAPCLWVGLQPDGLGFSLCGSGFSNRRGPWRCGRNVSA